MTIAVGKVVSLEYTLKNDEDEVLDQNVGGEPFSYTHGQSQVVQGLENALLGKKVGDTLSVTVKPELGYGLRDDEALIELPLDRIPETARSVGTRLQGQDDDGNTVYPVVHEIKDDQVVLDLNHPLAGETLHFDVKVLGVEDAPESAG